MKRFFLVPALLLAVQISYAQAPLWQTDTQIKQLTTQAIQFEDSGDYVKAFNSFLAAYNLDPTNYLAANSMAGDVGKLGDFNTERIWAQKALAIKPDYAAAYVNLGNSYAGQKNIEQAQQNYTKAATLDPKSPYPAYELGVLEEAQGNIKQAVAYYEKSEALDPRFEEAWFNLAAGYANLKNYDKAYQYISRFLRVHPNDKDAKEMYAHIVADMKARPFVYPTFPSSGNKPEDFVAKGWTIKEKTTGDLNSDGKADIAMVLEYPTITAEIRANNDTIHSNPRILLVLFKSGTGYTLAAQQKTFILRKGEADPMEGAEGDPYDNIQISKGILTLNFQFLRSHADYKFRYQDHDFFLIGARNVGVSANIMFDYDFDFLTRTLVQNNGESTDPADKTAKNKRKTTRLTFPKLKRLSELKQPFTWEPAKDVII